MSRNSNSSNEQGKNSGAVHVVDSNNAAGGTRLTDEELLASLGYKQEFKRAFKPQEVLGVAFSIIGLLPSIASLLFNSLLNGAGPAMVWGWLSGSIYVLFVGMAMAELASAAPTSGGLYFWAYSFSSPRWRNLLCWLVGYANTIGLVSGFASVNWGCAIQVMAAASIGSDFAFQPTIGQTYGVFVALTLLHCIVCSLGSSVLARLQNIYIGLNLALIIAIIVALPVSTPAEFKNTAHFALGEFVNIAGWPNGFTFILSYLTPLWSIAGFDCVVHISEEVSNATVAVPWAIVLAIIMSGILGFGLNMALAFCMGTDIESLLASPQPMAQIFFNAFGQRGTLGIWAFIVIVQFMMGSNALLAASRQTFAFSRDGALPLSKWLYRMNKHTRTPVNTVWFDAAIALLLALLAFAGAQAINAVFSIAVTAQYVAYIIPIAARYLGKNELKPGPFNLGRFSKPVAILAVCFMVFFDVVFMFPVSPGPKVDSMNYTCVVLGGVMLLSVIWYYLPVYGGVNWFTGPIPNINDEGAQVITDKASSSGSREDEKVQ